MAIFIVDQFSLNTDLPLDIRYVPNGGSYNDVSAYWYPGMQVYQTSDETIWYADNSLNWHPISEGADASLNELYQTVIDLSTYITNVVDPSIADLYNITNILDASIVRIDGSINALFDGQAIQDASIENLQSDVAQLDASIVRIDGSINDLYDWQIIQDVSIGDMQTDISNLETSVGDLDGLIQTNITDISNLETSVGDLDGLVQTNITDISNLESSVGDLDGLVQTNITDISNLETSVGTLDGLIQTNIEDIDAIEASLGDYVRKDGDTMTGPLTITGGGLQVGTIGDPQDVSIYSNLYIHNDTVVGGNLTVDGSLYITNVETIDVSAAFIHLNTGLTGTPPPSMQSGIEIGRGDEDPYVFIFDESTQTFRIGIASETSTGYLDSSTLAVATRQDIPVANGIAVWNNTESRFDTYTELVFDGNTLTLDGSLKLSDLAGGTDRMLVVDTAGNVIAQAIPNNDASLNELYLAVNNLETSVGDLDGLIQTNITDISNLETSVGTLDGLIQTNITDISNLETSVGDLDGLIQTNIENIFILDSSVGTLDSSVTELYGLVGDTSVKGAINIGDGSAGAYAGLTADGSLQFREFVGANGINVLSSGDLISIEIDASFSGGEINTASNIGAGEGLSVAKVGVDLPFKSIDTLDPSHVIITADNSTVYIDVSLGDISVDASLVGLTDTSLNEAEFVDHTNMEWDETAGKWVNTTNLVWDTSLGTTTDDLGGIPAGTNLLGDNLKEILMKILYEYQIPVLSTFATPTAGTYEKGIAATQFASIDIDWNAANTNYPLALLNNIHISKTGVGSIYDASLGLVASDIDSYTDATGITNWGGTNRTISYNVTIDDDQSDQSQPAVGSSESFTFYYRQFWGEVAGTTNSGDVDSALIKTLDSSRLAGESDLTATFDYPGGAKIKYLFAYPDTVAAPDNFGTLSQIVDQNDFDITSSWDTGNVDVSVGVNNIRYRYYLLKNKVDTPTFDVTFKF